ncbi:fatty acid-binding protein [Oxobacter pfennigii]|uniref:Fatty acid-binding protein n=1 Tax=Oxobacter pfennigii TaxID=36849 RepID=A0A0P8W962_9CLOT|nr:DegV family protein [Oxobacter pfennigii]KPU45186.1 fatty acid-binding protein [Oxobacter pfennigii]
MGKIILSADSTCDLGEMLREKYNVYYRPLHIILGDKQYDDGVDIAPDDIYDTYKKHRILPKTAAPNPSEYVSHFKRWTDEGFEVVHINIGSGLSSSFQNCCIAAAELKNVYPIDSHNLSAGTGLLVLEAAERIGQGMPASQIQQEIMDLRTKSHASFIVDNLTYLYEGGRCSAIAALGANILNIKPCIEVDNTSGKMSVGKKYRGSLDKVLRHYTLDKLNQYTNIRTDKAYIAHSGISEERINFVSDTMKEIYDFKEIYVSRAGCTISSHCGPNTLGVFFMTK